MKLFVVVLLAAAACSGKKSSPSAAAGDGGATGTAAAAVTDAAPAAAAGPKLGPIDLSASTIDLAALFPGAAYELHPAEDQTGGGSMPDGYLVDTAEVRRDGKLLVQAELDGTKLTKLTAFDASIDAPGPVRPGEPASVLATRHADATCMQNKYGVFCQTAKLPGFLFAYTEGGMEGDWDTDQPIAKLDGTTKLTFIDWIPDEAKRPAVAARPTVLASGEGADEDAGRKPTAEEIDRCARLHVITSKCGVSDDYEFGWIKTDVKAVSAAAAKKACDLPSITDEDGMSALPVKVLAPDQLAKVEAAAKRDCKALFAALDEVDPRITEAGGHPAGEP